MVKPPYTACFVLTIRPFGGAREARKGAVEGSGGASSAATFATGTLHERVPGFYIPVVTLR